jgi:ATP-dependent Lhr-like helicase
MMDENIIKGYYAKFGYTNLTKVQEKSIPLLIRRVNTLIIAPTGSGKTEAAMIPIMAMLADEHKDNNNSSNGVKVLYITPLRALNRDMLRRITYYANSFNLRVDVRHGDTSQYRRRKILSNPPDILITTPETLALILASNMRNTLHAIEWIVVDELHELIASKRGAHLTVSMERVERLSNKHVTRVGLSATISSIDTAARFLVGNGRRCAVVKDNRLRHYDVKIKYIDAPMQVIASYIIDYVKDECKGGSVLLFTNTRDEAEYIASIMHSYEQDASVSVDVHHGSLSREVREETEMRLRDKCNSISISNTNANSNNNNTNIVVCTSSLELGIDVGSIGMVIHYGSPRQVSKMAQRIGRSMHSIGKDAKGLIIASNVDDELEALAILTRLRRGSIEEQRMHDNPLDVLAHHLVGLALEHNRDHISIYEAFGIVSKAYPFKDISIEDIKGCLEILAKQDIVRYDEDKLVYKAANARIYYYNNASMIPDVLKFDVFDIISNKVIGSLDQEFVGDYCDQGSIFILKGLQWRVISVDYQRLMVNVEPYYGSSMNIPYWSGEMIPVDYATATLVGKIRRAVINGNNYNVSDNSKSILKTTFKQLNTIPDENRIVIEYKNDGMLLIIHSCFGTRVNNTLAALLSTILSSMLGYVVNSRSDAYRIMVSSNLKISKGKVYECLYSNYDISSIITASLINTHNLNWKVWNVAKHFGIVDGNAVYDKRVAKVLYERYKDTPVVKEALRELLHEKYDVELTDKILDGIRAGKIKVVWVDVDSISPLAEQIVERELGYTTSATATNKALSDEQGIIQMVYDRLINTKHRLVCLTCCYNKVVDVVSAPDNISCDKCNSRLIASIHPYDDDTLKAIMLKIKHKRLSDDQEHRFRRAWKSASLIYTFGKKALLVLSGHGIGVDSAARILSMYDNNSDDENTLVRRIYEAEMQYIRTRGFWDS